MGHNDFDWQGKPVLALVHFRVLIILDARQSERNESIDDYDAIAAQLEPGLYN